MRRAICCGLTLVLSILVTGCSQITGAAPQANQPATGTMSLSDLHDLGDLQARFNQDAGKPRLLLLVSPT
jgi:hypothetical protein